MNGEPMIKGFRDDPDDVRYREPGDPLPNSKEAIAQVFTKDNDHPLHLDHARMLVAVYDTPPWHGEAFVLFEDMRDHLLYEVNASHCSCYGLEGQWEPELINRNELVSRPAYIGSRYDTEYTELNEQIRSAMWSAMQEARS